MSTSCEHYESLISRMLDGDLLPGEADALRDHIRTCKHCRGLCAALSAMTLSLREDPAEPPAGLKDSVMGRIRTWESEKALEEAAEAVAAQAPEAAPAEEAPEEEFAVPEYIPRVSRTPKKKNRWMPTLAAACLMVVIGGSLFLTMGRGGSAESTAADSAEAQTYARSQPQSAADSGGLPQEAAEAVAEEAAPAALTMEEPEEIAPAAEAGPAEAPEQEAAEPETEAAPQAPTADEEEADLTEETGHNLSNPASVPPGREADFEAILLDAGWPDGMPDVGWQVILAVEYNGEVYEFMTDDSRQYLLWRSSNQGPPAHASGSVSDLLALFE